MRSFCQRILFVAFGAVARCTLPILLQHIDVDPKRITIIDFDPDAAALKPWTDGFNRPRLDVSNLWQFKNVLITDGD